MTDTVDRDRRLAAVRARRMEGAAMNPSRFEIFEDDAGEYRFRLRAGNGEIVSTSEGYRDATDARRGIEALVNAVDAARSGPADLRLEVVEVET